MLTWLQVISMGQRGDAAIETTSVPLMKPLRTALCQRRRALLHCGDLDRSQTTGLTCVGSLTHLIQIGIGWYEFMVLSPFAPPIKAATRHGSTLNSSIGAALNHIMKNMTDGFSSERPTACPFGQQQRRTSEVTSRPFALFVTVRPFARVYLYYAKHVHPHEVT